MAVSCLQQCLIAVAPPFIYSDRAMSTTEISRLLLVARFDFVLSGCGGESEPEVAATVVPDCAFPDSPTIPAPEWVCTEFLEGVPAK